MAPEKAETKGDPPQPTTQADAGKPPWLTNAPLAARLTGTFGGIGLPDVTNKYGEIRMKKSYLAGLAFSILISPGNIATATVIDGPVVSYGPTQYTTFFDDATNRLWLDLPNMYNKTYIEMLTEIIPTDFRVATLYDIQELFQSLPNPYTNYTTYAAMIGSASPWGVPGMYGLYDDDDSTSGLSDVLFTGYAYAFNYDGYPDVWSISNYDCYQSYVFHPGVGLWAFKESSPVPEPATMLLFGTGIAGLAGSRLRRKKQ